MCHRMTVLPERIVSMRTVLIFSFLFQYPLLLWGQHNHSHMSSSNLHDNQTPVGIMLDHTMNRGQWMVAYRFMSVHQNKNLSGSAPVSDDKIFQQYIMAPGSMRMDMHMAMLMYGLSDRITLMTMLNYNAMHMDMRMIPSGMMMNMPGMIMGTSNMNMRTCTVGLGDTKLYALYNVVNRASASLFLSGGLSLPTGNIRLTGTKGDMYNGQRLPYTMQMGSGTLDILPGITLQMYRNSFTGGMQATSVIRTHYNSIGYKLGNELNFSQWASYRWKHWVSTSIRAEESEIGKIQGADPYVYGIMEPSTNPGNYGGTRINAFAGVNFFIHKGLAGLNNSRFALEYGIPVYQHVQGIQSSLQSSLYVGWQLAF